MNRVVLGGIVGGIALFAWGAFSHMVLQLGEIGIRTIPNEDAFLQTMRASLAAPGFYLFPAEGAQGTEDEQRVWAARYRQGPVGVLVFDPRGKEPMAASMLLRELLSNVLAAIIAAHVVSKIAGARLARAGIVALLGVFTWLAVDVSYWTWYSFPADFTLGALLDSAIAWLLVGFVVTAIVRPPADRAVA